MTNLLHLRAKNKFGLNSYIIEIDRLTRFVVEEANNNTYIIDFRERGIFWDTIFFSFASDQPLSECLERAVRQAHDILISSTSTIFNVRYFKQWSVEVVNYASKIEKYRR